MKHKTGNNSLEDLINSTTPVGGSELARVFERIMDKYDRMGMSLQEYQHQLSLVGKVLHTHPKIDFNLNCLEFIKYEIEKYQPTLLKKLNKYHE